MSSKIEGDFGRAGAYVIRKLADLTPPDIKRALSQVMTDAIMRAPQPLGREMIGIAQDPENILRANLAELRLRRHLLPQTVAIIPDGNRREARRLGISEAEGHDRGARMLHRSLRVFEEFTEIKNIIIWAWSTDNEVQRSHEEKMNVFGVIAKYLRLYTPELKEKNVRITYVGRDDRLEPQNSPLEVELQLAKDATHDNTGTNIILGIDWGEDVEEALAQRAAIASGTRLEDVTPEKAMEIRRGSMSIPPPDMVVRTSGEMRLSRLPYGGHAELVIVDTKLPALMPHEIAGALLEYTRRDIRKGK